MSFVSSCVTHTCVCRKAHEQGVLPGTEAALVLPAHPSQRGHWKGQDWLLVRGEHPWRKCLAWGNMGLVNAISAVLQQVTGVSHGGAAFGEGLLSCMESSWGTQE